MSYHDYRKMMGENPKDIPHLDLKAKDPRFEGFATLYLHPETNEPLQVSWYLWTGTDEVGYIKEYFKAQGYDLSEFTEYSGGNGHYVMRKPEPK